MIVGLLGPEISTANRPTQSVTIQHPERVTGYTDVSAQPPRVTTGNVRMADQPSGVALKEVAPTATASIQYQRPVTVCFLVVALRGHGKHHNEKSDQRHVVRSRHSCRHRWLCDYPMAVFTVGANDSSQEVWGISLAFLSLFPTSILALRFRLIAGCIMLFVPCFFIYASLAQRTFMVNVRHFPQPPIGSKQIIGSFALTWPYVVLGAFAILTSMLSWPPVVQWPRSVSLPKLV